MATSSPAATRRAGPRSKAPPVRVLIACDHIDYDGALHGGGRQLIELVRALEHTSVDATVVILRGASSLGRALRDEGLPVHFFGDGRFNPVTLYRLVKLIRERKIDVLHLTDFGASTFGRLAGWMTGTPAIVQIISHHSPHQRRGFPRIAELAYRACAPLTARALAISASVKDFAVQRMGFAADEVEVLTYPLPRHSFHEPTPEEVAAVRRTLGIGPGEPVVGSVTRFYPSKGIRYLIDAFARTLSNFPDAWLVLLGQGPEEAMLRERAEALGIERRVRFAGFQRDAHAWVGAFSVSVVPSVEEGFGLVALESLALGVPVVASRVGGLPDIVTHGRDGLLVEPEDAAGIAEAVDRLLEDPGLRRRMGKAARRSAQRFSLDRYVGRLVALYRELGAGRSRGGA